MTPTVTETFAALGDPVRSTIVDRLAVTDATVGELVALFAISFQAVSKHLDVLERGGLITRERAGRTRVVRLNTATLDAAAGWLEARRLRLEERYQRLDAVLQSLTDPAERTQP
jgi:DNA-binding transcriptional ArsR family regulator